MSTYCTHCGNGIDPGDRFCPSCGRSTTQGRDRRVTVLVSLAAALIGAGMVAAAMILIPEGDTPVAAPESTRAESSTSSSTSSSTIPETTTSTSVLSTTVAVVDLDSAEIARRFGDAVWRVDVEGCGYLGSGSAFAISPTHFVTNHHVVEIDVTPRLASRAGETLWRAG